MLKNFINVLQIFSKKFFRLISDYIFFLKRCQEQKKVEKHWYTVYLCIVLEPSFAVGWFVSFSLQKFFLQKKHQDILDPYSGSTSKHGHNLCLILHILFLDQGRLDPISCKRKNIKNNGKIFMNLVLQELG